MNVEILGIHPENKGAGLMLEAVRAQLASRFGTSRLAVSLDTPPDARLRLGLWATLPRGGGRKRALLRHAGQLAPSRLLRRFGVLADGEIDVVLDASGFAYGDFWGARKMSDRIARHVAGWKRRGRRVVLLPQAWGPFGDPGFAQLLEEVCTHADLVYARDETSLRHLKDAVGDRPNLRLGPDFTNLLEPDLPSRLRYVVGQALIIPNGKVIEALPSGMRETYLGFLVAAARAIEAAGMDASILIHEGRGDLAIAVEVNTRLERPLNILDEADPLTSKAIVAHSAAVISSRFHGLVSGLAAGVPCLACGWSHKYLELFKDYGCPEHAIELASESDIDGRLRAFLQDATSNSYRTRLISAGETQRARAAAMWDDVCRVLGSKQAA